jgi:hypothetical protein
MQRLQELIRRAAESAGSPLRGYNSYALIQQAKIKASPGEFGSRNVIT